MHSVKIGDQGIANIVQTFNLLNGFLFCGGGGGGIVRGVTSGLCLTVSLIELDLLVGDSLPTTLDGRERFKCSGVIWPPCN